MEQSFSDEQLWLRWKHDSQHNNSHLYVICVTFDSRLSTPYEHICRISKKTPLHYLHIVYTLRICIALDKTFSTKYPDFFFLFLNENVCFGYSLKLPQWVTATYVFVKEKKRKYILNKMLLFFFSKNSWFFFLISQQKHVGPHWNCLNNWTQFQWVPTTYIF